MPGFLSNLVKQAVPAATGFLQGRSQGEQLAFERDLDTQANERAQLNAETQAGFLEQQQAAREREEADLLERLRLRREEEELRRQAMEDPLFDGLSDPLRALIGGDQQRFDAERARLLRAQAPPAPPSEGTLRARENAAHTQRQRQMQAIENQAVLTARQYARAARDNPADAELLMQQAVQAIGLQMQRAGATEPLDATGLVEREFERAGGGGGGLTQVVGGGDGAAWQARAAELQDAGMSPDEIRAQLKAEGLIS